MPQVSVIVPNYNHAPYLRQRIDSILNQTFQDFELILLDDCSTDNSREVLESYRSNPHVSQIVYNEKNGGSPFAQWNKGIELAKGEWIWIAESDDWAELDFLETIIPSVESNPKCALGYTLTNFMQGGNKMWEIRGDGSIDYIKGEEYILGNLLFNNPIHNVSMLVFRKQYYPVECQNLYNKMVLCGDWFFYVLLCMRGDVVQVNKVCSNYRIHNETSTSGKGEPLGLTFIEGVKILDYIKAHFNLSKTAYEKKWGKLWCKYLIQYSFSNEVNSKIFKIFISKYPKIVFYYLLYSMKDFFKKK